MAADDGRVGESCKGEAEEMEDAVLQRRAKGRDVLMGPKGMGCDASKSGSVQSAGESHMSASKRISITCPSRMAILLVANYPTAYRKQNKSFHRHKWLK